MKESLIKEYIVGGAGGALKIKWRGEDTIAMENYLDILTKEAYEEHYNERVMYCRVHHSTGIDGCSSCDEEREDYNVDEEESNA